MVSDVRDAHRLCYTCFYKNTGIVKSCDTSANIALPLPSEALSGVGGVSSEEHFLKITSYTVPPPYFPFWPPLLTPPPPPPPPTHHPHFLLSDQQHFRATPALNCSSFTSLAHVEAQRSPTLNLQPGKKHRQHGCWTGWGDKLFCFCLLSCFYLILALLA